MNKFVQPCPYADPEAAARKLMELAHAFEPIQDGRIFIEAINGPFLFQHKGTPAEYSAGLKLCVERGWLALHESGTFVRLTRAGADLFAEPFGTGSSLLSLSTWSVARPNLPPVYPRHPPRKAYR